MNQKRPWQSEWTPRPMEDNDEPYNREDDVFPENIQEQEIPYEDYGFSGEDCWDEDPELTEEEAENEYEDEDDGRQPIEKRKTRQYYGKPKKHRFLKWLLKFLLILLVLMAAALLTLHFFSSEPKNQNGLGVRREDCCTILVVGQDKASYSTDTILLLRVDRGAGKLNLMSIPRDTKVNSTYTPHKINAAYACNGGAQGDAASGMDALMDYVAQCVGFRPDGYILVDLDVFIKLVNLFGGVEFDVPTDMYYDDPAQDLHIALDAGLQKLNGEEAMGLVRFRSGYADADIGRVRVQRDFIRAALDQWATPWQTIKLPAALVLLSSACETNLSVTELYWLAESALVCGTEDMYMTTMPFYFSDIYVIIAADSDYLNLLNDCFNPYETPITWEDLNIAY